MPSAKVSHTSTGTDKAAHLVTDWKLRSIMLLVLVANRPDSTLLWRSVCDTVCSRVEESLASFESITSKVLQTGDQPFRTT